MTQRDRGEANNQDQRESLRQWRHELRRRGYLNQSGSLCRIDEQDRGCGQACNRRETDRKQVRGFFSTDGLVMIDMVISLSRCLSVVGTSRPDASQWNVC